MANDNTPTGSKVSRVVSEHKLAGLGEELEHRWIGVEAERQSLRDLADYFNHRVLEAALEDAGKNRLTARSRTTTDC